jgi:hypothetical protein
MTSMKNTQILSNPGKTAIFKTVDGWFDKDNPTVFHATRWQARVARSTRKNGNGVSPVTALTYNSDGSVTRASAMRSTLRAVTPAQPAITSLQERAAARLRSMGVDDADINEVVPSFGYNAAVSYGHMRLAGATHDEALEVISLGFPDVSLSYGQKRHRGMNHTDALVIALDE